MIGLIHDVPTCADLVQRIEREAIDTINKTRSLYTDSASGDGQPEAGKQIQDPSADPKSEHGAVGPKTNNPEAQLWGVGKTSKL